MTWFDIDGARRYLAQQEGSVVPSRKAIYRMVDSGLRVARAEGRPDAKRGGTRMLFCAEWIDEFLTARAEKRNAASSPAIPTLASRLGDSDGGAA